jgi:hypothetical protein
MQIVFLLAGSLHIASDGLVTALISGSGLSIKDKANPDDVEYHSQDLRAGLQHAKVRGLSPA